MVSIVDILNAQRDQYIPLDEKDSYGVRHCAVCGALLPQVGECTCIGSQLARNHNAHCEIKAGA